MSDCEGQCEEHTKHIARVHVVSKDGFDWGHFNYCDEAIRIDKKYGFIVMIEEEP